MKGNYVQANDNAIAAQLITFKGKKAAGFSPPSEGQKMF
jgi:hypothetical protein